MSIRGSVPWAAWSLLSIRHRQTECCWNWSKPVNNSFSLVDYNGGLILYPFDICLDFVREVSKIEQFSKRINSGRRHPGNWRRFGSLEKEGRRPVERILQF